MGVVPAVLQAAKRDERVRCRLSKLDTQRFGVPVARVDELVHEELDRVLEFCATRHVDLLIARCRDDDPLTIAALQRCGFEWLDTLTYWLRDGQRELPPQGPMTDRIYPLQPGEADLVRQVARQAFQGYQGHYHADSRLPQVLCNETYADWAYRYAAASDGNGKVLVARVEQQIVGFTIARMLEDCQGDLVLSGVLPEFRRVGIFKALHRARLAWLQTRGGRRIWASTVATNLATRKTYASMDFRLHHSYRTFHRWFT